MSTAPANPRTRRLLPARVGSVLSRVLPAVVLGLVVGILGMHALGSSHEASMSAGDMSHMGTASMAHAGPAASGVTTAHPRSDSGHELGAMLMLCAAMLLSAGALLLVWLALRGTPPPWRWRSALDRARVRVRRRLVQPTGPPPVWEFSVVRC